MGTPNSALQWVDALNEAKKRGPRLVANAHMSAGLDKPIESML